MENVGQGHGGEKRDLQIAKIKVTKYNFRNEAIQWQISKFTNIIFTFVIFAKVRPVRKKVTDIHTHINKHTDTETDKPIAIGEILQISLLIYEVCTAYSAGENKTNSTASHAMQGKPAGQTSVYAIFNANA